MKRTLLVILGASVLILLSILSVLPVVDEAGAASTTYSAGDLLGTWRLKAIATGPSEPWWMAATIEAAAGGNVTGISQDSEGPADDLSFKWTVAKDGRVKVSALNSSTSCYMDAGKTVIACTQLTDENKLASLMVAVKGGTPYLTDDLAGTWGINGVASGAAAPWWEAGSITMDSSGVFSGTVSHNTGADQPTSGQMQIGTDGTVTVMGSAATQCAMDAGKTIILCLNTTPTVELRIYTKKASSYVQEDLAGKWAVNSLSSGGSEGGYWYRGLLTIDATGLASGTVTGSDHSKDTVSRSLTLSSDGYVTNVSSNTAECGMDADRSVTVCSVTESSGGGTVEMVVFLNTTPPSITTLSPAKGTAGDAVTITGKYFGPLQRTSTVTFNGTPATISSWSDTSIVCIVPDGATTGTVNITTSVGSTTGKKFTVMLPSISATLPKKGAVGSTITIKGKYFGPSQGSSSVTFNGVAATVSSWSATSIVCTVPDGATTGLLKVTTSVGSSKGKKFTVVP